MSLLVNVVNVFVDERGRHGNPLGIVWTSPATVGQEQQIAADLGFSETISAELGRDLDITRGRGSRIHNCSSGDRVEVGGRVSEARVVELQ